MKTMICKSIETINILGVDLIEVKWVSSTGRVEAKSRAQTLDQYVVGQSYVGKLGYLPCSIDRVFSAKMKVG